jgi:hypothetical protein
LTRIFLSKPCVGGGLVQEFRDTEVAREFEMCPVVERIAERVRDGARPCDEFVVRRGAAGAVFFIHAVAAHRAPFVMVAFEPDFKEVTELAVGGDILGRDVAVVIEAANLW